MVANEVVDVLDRRIIAALQVNGRAGWRRIASVLGVPERTVTARATELLRTGAVRVTALTLLPRGGVPVNSVIAMRCTVGMPRITASALMARSDVTFSYITTGEIDCVAEMMTSEARTAAALLDELPGVPGAAAIEAHRVLRHYRAMHQWRPDILDAAQIASLNDPGQPWEPTGSVPVAPLSKDEELISRTLAADGRATIEELARASGLSPTSARRRLAGLFERGRLFTRAVVEPRTLGFPVEALLWIRTAPGKTGEVAAALLDCGEVRYLAEITGRYQLLANVAFRDHDELREFLMQSWTAAIAEVNTAMVLAALKRSGVRLGDRSNDG